MIQALNKAEECVFHLDPSLFVMIAAAAANHLCCARFCSCNFLGSWRACKGCGCGMQVGGSGAFLLHMRTLQYPPVYIRSTYCRCCFLAEDKQLGELIQGWLHITGDTVGHTALGTSIHIRSSRCAWHEGPYCLCISGITWHVPRTNEKVGGNKCRQPYWRHIIKIELRVLNVKSAIRVSESHVRECRGESRDIERADATVRGGLARRETCADATVCAGTCGDIEQMTNNVRCGRACKTWIYLGTKRNGHDGRAGVARLRRQTSREARRWSGR